MKYRRTKRFKEKIKKISGGLSRKKDIKASEKMAEGLVAAKFRIMKESMTRSVNEILQIVLDEAEFLTGSSIGFYHFVSRDQASVSLQGWSSRTLKDFCRAKGDGTHYYLENAGIWAECVKKRRAVICNDYAAAENKKGLPEGHALIKRFVSVPVSHGGVIVAIAGVGNKEKPYNGYDVTCLSELFSLCFEIVDRKRAEDYLNKTFQFLTAHIDNSPLAVIEFDPMLRVTRWSKEAKRIFGWSVEEVFEKSIADFNFVYENDAEYVGNEIKGLLNGKKRRSNISNRNRRKDGAVIDCEWYNSGIYDEDGKLISILSLALDVTARKKAADEIKAAHRELVTAKEAAEKANRVKSVFLANISHEIRTPINAIGGFVDLMLETGLTSEQAEYLEYIKRSCSNLTRIINDVLDISRIESGKITIERSGFDIKCALDESIVSIKKEARAKGIAVKLFIDAFMPVFVKGDEVRLRQIIDNLLVNALKFTEKGEITVAAEEISRHGANSTIRFRVADTGIGIPKSMIEELFQPFTQLDMSMGKKYKGAGLGLSIVKNLAALMGGTVGVKSEPGTGSEFSVELPFERCDRPQPAHIPGTNALKSKPTAFKKFKLLAVEDDDPGRALIKKITARLGHETDLAVCGAEALEMIGSKKYDLVLLDIQLPDISGIELTRIIRENEGENGGHLPIIAVTAYALNEEREKIMAAGVDGYLAKPVDAARLGETIDEVMKNAESKNDN